ncbi:uncharacterized protein LAJ45_07002 [Morchella importuna]|uniref:uncharacterized protein n=1 Tax=Morchella importuna TaxID=1174673 RepID=UPI001E8D797C|nr:uncharacterized protein LAJ45_07002 [Morchella importuna]KAH8149026.1 hypothetical protein LAJ45_07002 [Morchella importuna]
MSVLGKRARPTSPSFAVVVDSPIRTKLPARKNTSSKKERKTVKIHDDDDDFEDTIHVAIPRIDDSIPRTPKKLRRDLLEAQVTPSSRGVLSPTVFRGVEALSMSIDSKNLSSPSTPRHKHSVKKPITPRHRVSAIGKPLTPRSGKLFGTPTKAAMTPTIMTTAKVLFSRSGEPGRLVGRDEEKRKLAAFLEPRLEACSGGCLYVSGPPGCGKSALLTEVMGDLGADKAVNVKRAYVNCMTMQSPTSIYVKLLEEFYKGEELSSPTGMAELEALFIPKKSLKKQPGEVFVVVLDEIDHLLTKDQEVLYSIFEWSLVRSSRLILLGIANALDLTDRFLPRLKARNLTPQLLPFLPYTAEQIASVITNRLRSLLPNGTSTPGDFVPFMHPAAIQLASRKVAAATGDLRKAFDLCRRAVELVESETRAKEIQQKQLETKWRHITRGAPCAPRRSSKPQHPAQALFHCPPAALTSLTIQTAPRVMLSHIAKVSAASFGGSTISRVKTLNLQQKAVLCVLVTAEKTRGSVTVRQLFEAYAAVCKRERLLHPLTNTEFRDVVNLLDVAGVVSAVGGGAVGGTPSKKKKAGIAEECRIGACVREMDLLTAVADVGPILTRLFDA